jgi:hypothetical protein
MVEGLVGWVRSVAGVVVMPGRGTLGPAGGVRHTEWSGSGAFGGSSGPARMLRSRESQNFWRSCAVVGIAASLRSSQ